MKFKTDFVRSVLWEESDEGRLVENKLVETSRWSAIYEMVFEVDGKFYSTSYSQGLTEYQDEQPFEYSGDVIDCVQVEPKLELVTKWIPTSKLDTELENLGTSIQKAIEQLIDAFNKIKI